MDERTRRERKAELARQAERDVWESRLADTRRARDAQRRHDYTHQLFRRVTLRAQVEGDTVDTHTECTARTERTHAKLP